MTSCSYFHIWRLPKRQVLTICRPSQLFYRHVSVHIKSRKPLNPGPTSSQLLRFALAGISLPNQRELSISDPDKHLAEIFSEEWPLNSPPPPLWSSPQWETSLPDEQLLLRGLRHVRSLRHLQLLIERSVNEREGGVQLQADRCNLLTQALERCQRHNSYEEILSVLNGIISRLEKLRVPLSNELYILGMFYSSLAFSDSALQRHLRGYFTTNNQPIYPKSSALLVSTLLSSFKALSFQDPTYDTSKMLCSITGEVGTATPSLHSMLCWADPNSPTEFIGDYLSLLVKVRSTTVLTDMWNFTLKKLSHSSTFNHFQSAYTGIMALIDAGDPSRALAYLTQVSKRANNTLPGISKFKDLDNLLEAPAFNEEFSKLAGEDEYLLVLEARLEHIERKLGIKWHSDKSLHTNVSDYLSIASEQPLLTIDGDSFGYESSQRLIAEIESLGCSKSISDLENIPDLLDDFDGDLIPVSVSSCEGLGTGFFWVPRRSPLELCDTSSMHTSLTDYEPASILGLIRVRRERNGYPLAVERNLNLIQLGYLVRQKTPSSGEENPRVLPFLEETGHIVTWDRAAGQFLVVFAGKSSGRVDKTEWQPQSIPFGLAAIAPVLPLTNTNNVSPTISNLWSDYILKYQFDVDRGQDLMP